MTLSQKIAVVFVTAAVSAVAITVAADLIARFMVALI